MLKALAHPTRLCIVKDLIKRENNVSKIQECLDLPQSTTSQHLFKLRVAGIVEGHRNGLEISYRVTNKDIKKIIKILFPQRKNRPLIKKSVIILFWKQIIR